MKTFLISLSVNSVAALDGLIKCFSIAVYPPFYSMTFLHFISLNTYVLKFAF